jgi:hypothetical protein
MTGIRRRRTRRQPRQAPAVPAGHLGLIQRDRIDHEQRAGPLAVPLQVQQCPMVAQVQDKAGLVDRIVAQPDPATVALAGCQQSLRECRKRAAPATQHRAGAKPRQLHPGLQCELVRVIAGRVEPGSRLQLDDRRRRFKTHAVAKWHRPFAALAARPGHAAILSAPPLQIMHGNGTGHVGSGKMRVFIPIGTRFVMGCAYDRLVWSRRVGQHFRVR